MGISNGGSTPQSDSSFSGKQLTSFSGYCVYAWKRSDEWLYVGCSSRGLARLLAYHNIVGVMEDVQDSDEFVFWFSDSWDEVVNLEASLILQHQPKYNAAGRKRQFNDGRCHEIPCVCCGNTFMQNRSWQRRCRECGTKAGTIGKYPMLKLVRERRGDNTKPIGEPQ